MAGYGTNPEAPGVWITTLRGWLYVNHEHPHGRARAGVGAHFDDLTDGTVSVGMNMRRFVSKGCESIGYCMRKGEFCWMPKNEGGKMAGHGWTAACIYRK